MQNHQQQSSVGRPVQSVQRVGSSPMLHHPSNIAAIYGKKSGGGHHKQSSHGGGGGFDPLTLPQLQVPIVASRNSNQLNVAKTQKTPKHGSTERPLVPESNTIGPFINDFNKMAHIVSIAEPTTPQKMVKELFSQRQPSTGTGKKAKTVHRKHKKINNFPVPPTVAAEGGVKQAHQAAQNQASNKVDPPNIVTVREANIQGSEKKLNKYDRMLQSLEAVATKQRKNMHTGSSKKALGSTEATDPPEALKYSLDTAGNLIQLNVRSNTLSMSSCISKNTGSNTAIGRERLTLLQQQQLAMQKQSIFDRNRPWNCSYCQPKACKASQIDKKIGAFSRQCLSQMVSRFMIKQEFYESRKVMELLNTNARSVLVAQFKDYLIFDDIYEFLTSSYQLAFSLDILTKHAVFYDSLKSLEVLCQYREDQIRDRHLVLHGLKPSYIGLEKPIQSILASNLRNKLRIILNKVRKIQLNRGTLDESSLDDDSSNMLPRSPSKGLTATSKKKKKNFIKLIQSSMVQEYNFSRSHSGLLIVKTAERAAEPRFESNSSINFTNMSYEGEIELMKGSVFEESLERDVHNNPKLEIETVEHIESMYHNAQMILDNLSSRPLTRQSIPQTNSMTPASRLHMYELHRQEELKVRIPFCIVAPKRNQTDMSHSLPSNGEIMINDNQESFDDQQILQKKQILRYEKLSKNDHNEHQLADGGEQPEICIQLQAQDENDGYEPYNQTTLKSNSAGSKLAEMQQTTTVSAQLDGLGANPVTQSSAHASSLSQVEMMASAVTVTVTSRPSTQVVNKQKTTDSQSANLRIAAQLKQQIESFPPNAAASSQGAITSSQSTKKLGRDSAGNNAIAMPSSFQSKKVKKLSISKDRKIMHEPCSQPLTNRVGQHLQIINHQSDGRQYLSGSKIAGTPTSKASMNFKASPSNKNFAALSVHQHKSLTSTISKAYQQQVQQQQIQSQTNIAARAINSKKQSVPVPTHSHGFPAVGADADFLPGSTAVGNEDFGGLSARHNMNTQMRLKEQQQALLQGGQHDEAALVQKKMLASFKQSHMVQVSPVQAQKKIQALNKDRQSPTLPQTRQLLHKNSAGTKTFSSFTVKAVSIGTGGSQPQTTQPIQQIRSVKKASLKSSSKRGIAKEQSQVNFPRKAAQFLSEKQQPHFATAQASTDKKRVQKNQISLKEKVILEALRKEQSSQQRVVTTGVHHIALPNHHQSLTINDGLASKLMRTQQQQQQQVPGMLAHSNSTNSKMDLYSIASKLKLVNSPIQNNKAVGMPQQSVNQNSVVAIGGHHEVIQFSQRRNSNKMRLSSRKVSDQREDIQQFSRTSGQGPNAQPFRFFSADKQREPSENDSKALKSEKTQKLGLKRPTKLMPTAQQADAYYTQRNLQSVASVPNNLHSVRSRNLAEGSIDKNRNSQVQRVSKALVDNMHQKGKVTNSFPKKTTSQGGSKQISKLSRQNTGAMISPKGLGEIGFAGIVTPRKLIKDDTKTRNGGHLGGSQTQSQRIIAVNHGHPQVQSLKQTLTTAAKNCHQTKNNQHHQVAEVGQISRNSGGLYQASHTQTVKNLAGQQFVATRGSNSILPTGKLHSRKNSAVFTLSQGQKLQQSGLVGGSLGNNAKSFGAASSVPKKTRKKQQ